MLKKCFVIFSIFSILSFSVFAEDFPVETDIENFKNENPDINLSEDETDFENFEGTDTEENNEHDYIYDDWGDIFDNQEDIVVEQNENTDATQRQGLDRVLSDTLSLPLRFTGTLSSGVGVYGKYDIDPYSVGEKRLSDYLSGYFTLSNDLFLTARIDKSLLFRMRLNTTFPGAVVLELKELYCDYLFLDRVYITLGRKTSSWGYTRIFSSGDTYKSEDYLTDNDIATAIKGIELEGFLHTDILHDTANSISAMIKIPFWTGMFSTIFYYDIKKGNAYPSLDELKVAASLEMTLFHTTINLFGKKYEKNDLNPSYPLVGLEMKRSFWGLDIYGQFMTTLTDWRKFKANKIFWTVGSYKLFDSIIPNFGINAEYQQAYDFIENITRNRIAVEMGLKKMGKKNDLKLGVNWQHKFMDKTGSVKLLFIKSGVWKHCDWENALEFRYDSRKEKDVLRFRYVSSLKIGVDY